MADDLFPKTLYVQAGADPQGDEGRDFFGMEKLETMNDGDGARDGEEIAVYDLKMVRRVEVTIALIEDDNG